MDTPLALSKEKAVYSVIADDVVLKKFLSYITIIGPVIQVSYEPNGFETTDPISSLTLRQREIIKEALKEGYYEYPRKISAEILAKKVGISKPTLIEHLRKGEIRLIQQVFSGYSKL